MKKQGNERKYAREIEQAALEKKGERAHKYKWPRKQVFFPFLFFIYFIPKHRDARHQMKSTESIKIVLFRISSYAHVKSIEKKPVLLFKMVAGRICNCKKLF